MPNHDIDRRRSFTVMPVSAVPVPTAEKPQRPEFIRLPKGGLCPYTGLSRSALNQLVLPCAENGFRPPVKSVSLRKAGALKGTRLIHLDSLLGYLHGQMEGSMTR